MFSSNYHKYLVANIAAMFFLVFPLFAEKELQQSDLRLLVEPSFTFPPLAWPIAEAKWTVMVPARMVEGIPRYLTREEELQMGLSRQQIEEIARQNASITLAQLTPKFIRNSQGVILYAILESQELLTASTVLSPNFEKMFENTMGPKFLIVIPNRFRVYIFPYLFSPSTEVAEEIAMDFRATPYPISKEVFTLHKGIITCVGIIER